MEVDSTDGKSRRQSRKSSGVNSTSNRSRASSAAPEMRYGMVQRILMSWIEESFGDWKCASTSNEEKASVDIDRISSAVFHSSNSFSLGKVDQLEMGRLLKFMRRSFFKNLCE